MWSPGPSRRQLNRQRAQRQQDDQQFRSQRVVEYIERSVFGESEDFVNRDSYHKGEETFRSQQERRVQDQQGRSRAPYNPPRTPRMQPRRPEWESEQDYHGGEGNEAERSPSPPPYRSVATLPVYSQNGGRRDGTEFRGRQADNERLVRDEGARDRYGVSWLDDEFLARSPGESRESGRRCRLSFGRSSRRETDAQRRERLARVRDSGGGYSI